MPTVRISVSLFVFVVFHWGGGGGGGGGPVLFFACLFVVVVVWSGYIQFSYIRIFHWDSQAITQVQQSSPGGYKHMHHMNTGMLM